MTNAPPLFPLLFRTVHPRPHRRPAPHPLPPINTDSFHLLYHHVLLLPFFHHILIFFTIFFLWPELFWRRYDPTRKHRVLPLLLPYVPFCFFEIHVRPNVIKHGVSGHGPIQLHQGSLSLLNMFIVCFDRLDP